MGLTVGHVWDMRGEAGQWLQIFGGNVKDLRYYLKIKRESLMSF